MPRVSVIIPAFNSERVLPEALGSLSAQTYGDWEAVVCDDASTDATARVAESHGGPVRLVRSERNLGPAGARNLAIEEATGELLAFLDADDRWLPDYLVEQVSLFDRSNSKDGDVGIVACDALIEGPHGRGTSTYRDLVPFSEPLTPARLLVANPIFTAALAPREVVRKAGGFSTECLVAEDHDLWLRILELGYRAVSNPKALAVYRIEAGSLSADSGRMARNTQALYRRALARGRLGARERRIARRELRLHDLIARLADLRQERGAGNRVQLRSLLGLGGLAVVVALQNPQRWPRVSKRLLLGPGPVHDRLSPGRDLSRG